MASAAVKILVLPRPTNNCSEAIIRHRAVVVAVAIYCTTDGTTYNRERAAAVAVAVPAFTGCRTVAIILPPA